MAQRILRSAAVTNQDGTRTAGLAPKERPFGLAGT